MLQPEVPGFDFTSHKDLSYHQLMNRIRSKMLTETPSSKLHPDLASKLIFAQFLMSMFFHYKHKQERI